MTLPPDPEPDTPEPPLEPPTFQAAKVAWLAVPEFGDTK